MTKRAFIFDFGNVLMKTVDYTPRRAWDERLSLPPGSVERAVHNDDSWIQAQTGQIPLVAYWQDVAERLKLSSTDVAQLAEDFYSGDQLDMANIQLIERLRADGHPVALLSNDSLELLPKLERLGITHLFDPLVVSAQIRVMKPDAAAYQAVLSRLGRPAEGTVFIDDRQENIDGATALGIHGVLYTNDLDLESVLHNLRYA